MNPEHATTITLPAEVPMHCQQRSPSGRRCRMVVSDPQSGLCLRHAAVQQNNRDTVNEAATLIGEVQEFRSAIDINRCLGGLLKLLQLAPPHPSRHRGSGKIRRQRDHCRYFLRRGQTRHGRPKPPFRPVASPEHRRL
jgi:hypothetical protein